MVQYQGGSDPSNYLPIDLSIYLSVSAYVYMCVYRYIYICTCIYIHIQIQIQRKVQMHVHIHTYTYARRYYCNFEPGLELWFKGIAVWERSPLLCACACCRTGLTYSSKGQESEKLPTIEKVLCGCVWSNFSRARYRECVAWKLVVGPLPASNPRICYVI